MLSFNDLLRSSDADPAEVTLLLHNTTLQPLRAMLPSLAEDRPDLFAAYNSVHSDTATAAIRNRPLVAIFVPLACSEMLFEGLYRVAGATRRLTREIYANPAFDELERIYGATDTAPERNMALRNDQLQFDFVRQPDPAALRGRVVIRSPTGRAYARIAANTACPIVEVARDSRLSAPLPDWREITMSAAMVRAMPRSWFEKLSQWRGIYLIVDETDGARYVGAAYGAENLAGRWRAHVAGETGVTRELSRRDPARFRFSILERLSPDAPADDVVTLERTWMDRLDTIRHGLNA